LLISGSYGKMGASVLASKACLRTGAGLLTTHVPQKGYSIIQTAVPEAMVSVDKSKKCFSDVPDLTNYNAVGVGPGIGKSNKTRKALKNLIENATIPLVLDADALNILAENKTWIASLPENSILTPHPGEFRRLAGETSNSYERLMKQKEFAANHKVILIVKGAYTTIATPDGKIYFNSSGNAGMATAGSGDVLTGIILGLLAQRLPPEKAAVLGVYLHGLAGDLAAAEKSEPGMIAGDIIEKLGKSFLKCN
jgi:NAD(P)H-hydrate epimerase